MSLATDINFPHLPKHQHETMSSTAQKYKRHDRRYLNMTSIIPKLPTHNQRDEYTKLPTKIHNRIRDESCEIYRGIHSRGIVCVPKKRKSPQSVSRLSIVQKPPKAKGNL